MSEDIKIQDDAALGADDAPPAEAPQLSEVESLAAEMGWKPEADYTGATPWKPARDFIKTERDISREMRKNVKQLADRVERMAAAGTKATERALMQQAQELERKFADAVENKDTKGAAEAAREMRELEQEARRDFDPVKTESDFAAQNKWYNKDEEATAYAIAISQRLAAQGRSVEDQLEAAATGVRKRFPELFEDTKAPPPKKDPPALHTPQGGTRRAKERGFADLPPEVKRAAESHAQLVASRFGKSADEAKAQYAADYFADTAA